MFYEFGLLTYTVCVVGMRTFMGVPMVVCAHMLKGTCVRKWHGCVINTTHNPCVRKAKLTKSVAEPSCGVRMKSQKSNSA